MNFWDDVFPPATMATVAIVLWNLDWKKSGAALLIVLALTLGVIFGGFSERAKQAGLMSEQPLEGEP